MDYERTLKITEKGLKDVFQVESLQEGIFDYVFHLESDMEVSCSLDRCEADLGFRKNGYQHILEVQKIKTKEKTVLLKAVSKKFYFGDRDRTWRRAGALPVKDYGQSGEQDQKYHFNKKCFQESGISSEN